MGSWNVRSAQTPSRGYSSRVSARDVSRSRRRMTSIVGDGSGCHEFPHGLIRPASNTLTIQQLVQRTAQHRCSLFSFDLRCCTKLFRAGRACRLFMLLRSYSYLFTLLIVSVSGNSLCVVPSASRACQMAILLLSFYSHERQRR